MKTQIFAALVTLIASMNASAAVKTISDRDPNETLAKVPQDLVTVLRNSGVPFRALNNGVYSVSVKDLDCGYHANSALDPSSPDAAVATTICLANSEPGSRPQKGQKLADSIALSKVLGDIQLEDCAMGRCFSWAPHINCTVDTKVERFSGAGRFACTIDDGN